VGGENVVDKPCTHTGNFVRSDGRTHATAAEHDSALNLPGGHCPRQRDDEFRVVISGVQLMSAEVHDFVLRAPQQLRHLRLQDKAAMV
jgi:hypothetical protein